MLTIHIIPAPHQHGTNALLPSDFSDPRSEAPLGTVLAICLAILAGKERVGRVSCRTVQGAFNWLVDNYQRLADWRSSAHRVATLLIALDELEAKEMPKSPPSQQR